MAFLTSDQSPLAIEGSALYPTGTTGTIASNNAATVLSIPLGTLLAAGANTSQTQPALFDAKTVTIVINNNGTSQSITAASLQFTDTVGSGNPTITYTLPNVSIANNTTSTFVIHLSSGVLKTANLSITFGVAPVAGSANVQAVFHSTGVAAGGQTTTPIYISPTDGGKTTYSFARSTFTIAATPTDVAIITGSSSKTVRVTHIEIDALCTAATASALEVQLIKRSTANSGGTSTGSPTGIPHDSSDAAATSTMLCYTANPTSTGTSVGIIRDGKLIPVLSPYTATDFPQHDKLIWDFGNRPGKGIVLHGTAEGLAINLAGATIPAGLSMGISGEVTEE